MSSEEAIFITFTVIQGIIFLVGFYLQIRTFLVVGKEQHLTWKLDISYGVVMLIYYPSCMFTQATATHLHHPLADITGDWLCHLLSFLKIFGITVMYSNSLVTAIFKYIFIVHRADVDQLGKTKVEKTCFCLTAALQLLISISVSTNPNFLDLLGHMEYSTCFGIDKGNRRWVADFFSCGFEQLPPNSLFASFINITTECFCVLETTISIAGVCNLIEGYLYYKIFQCIYRYAKFTIAILIYIITIIILKLFIMLLKIAFVIFSKRND